MAKREPSVELFYDPAELDPAAPRLHIRKHGGTWELRDDRGVLLSTHPSQGRAVDAALRRSRARFSEILVRGSNGRAEWAVNQDPKWLKLGKQMEKVVARITENIA